MKGERIMERVQEDNERLDNEENGEDGRILEGEDSLVRGEDNGGLEV